VTKGSDFLNAIVGHKKKLLAEKKIFLDSLKAKLSKEKYPRYRLFKNKISQPGPIHLIAEIKKASPSKGMLRENFDVTAIAKTYVEHEAAAISVLTEEKFFLGKPEDVKKVSDNFNVPVLTKDFIIDENQLYEARANGASAILLIVSILDDQTLKSLFDVASRLDLDCLVEVHDENELKRALAIGSDIIGINNRNLHTFDVDIQTAARLIPQIPFGKVIVVESGIQSHQEVKKFQQLGAHAVLIGETLMRAQDIGKKIEEIMKGDCSP